MSSAVVAHCALGHPGEKGSVGEPAIHPNDQSPLGRTVLIHLLAQRRQPLKAHTMDVLLGPEFFINLPFRGRRPFRGLGRQAGVVKVNRHHPRPSLALGQGGRNLQPAQSPDKIDVEGRAQGSRAKRTP